MFASLQKGLTDAGNAVSKGAQSAALQTERTYYENEIQTIKHRWGRDAFTACVNGDTETVRSMALRANEEVAKLQAKIAALEDKRKGLDTPRGTQQMAIVVPAGAAPGSTFTAATPGGTHFTVTVPQNAVPGQQIVVQAPCDPAVVVGQPVPPPPPPR